MRGNQRRKNVERERLGWGIYDGKKKKVGKKSGFGNFLAFKMSMPIKFKPKKRKKERLTHMTFPPFIFLF